MDGKISLPANAKVTNITASQGKYIIDREGRLALSLDIEDEANRYNGLVLLDGSWASQWFDSFGSSAQSDNVFDLEVDDVKIQFQSSTRGSFREAPAGTLAVTDKGIILVGKPYSPDGIGPPVVVSLPSRKRAERCNDLVHMLEGWVMRGYREKELVFEVSGSSR